MPPATPLVTATAAQVATFAEQANLPNLVLTHFSARYQPGGRAGRSVEDIRSEAASHYRGQLFLAQDFLHLKLRKDGALEVAEATAAMTSAAAPA